MEVKINGLAFEAINVAIGAKLMTLELLTDRTVENMEVVIGKEPEVIIDGATYKGYAKLNHIQKAYSYAGHNHVVIVQLENVYDDSKALEAVFGERVTYDEAVSKRENIESMATNVPDEHASDYAWAFPAWSGDSVSYAVGDRVRFNALLWKCLTTHTSQPTWTPDTAVSLWVRVDNPGEEWPEWRQPQGAQDAYPAGYKVSHNSKHWTSDVANNVWEPGVYGWTEVTETTEDPTPTEPTTEEPVEESPAEWEQKTYMTGDKVTFNGHVYKSLIDNNVWSPEAYPTGWTEVE